MMNSDTREIKSPGPGETVDTCAEDPKKRKKRTEGRPHKRLLEPLLVKRKDDVRRKLEIHKAKCILLNERLELYEREVELRTHPA
jgi:hypothetical protein